MLTGIDILYAGNLNGDTDPGQPEQYPNAYFVAGSIKAATFVSKIYDMSRILMPSLWLEVSKHAVKVDITFIVRKTNL